MKQGHFVVLGWGALGDLTGLVGRPERFRTVLEEKYPGGNFDHAYRMAQRFVDELSEGDIVAAADGWRVLGVGEVTGEYEYRPDQGTSSAHRRRVRWLSLDDWPAPIPAGAKVPEGVQHTLIQLRKPETIRAINQRIGRRS